MKTADVAAVAGIGGKGISEQVLRIARKLGIPIANGTSGWPVAFNADEAIMVAIARALVEGNCRQRSYRQFRSAADSVATCYRAGARPAWLVIVGPDHTVWPESAAAALADELLTYDGAAVVLRLRPILDRLEAVA